jgi:hypothetical protein
MKQISRQNCSLCDEQVVAVIDLPELPLTGIFSRNGCDPKFPTYDQKFMMCTNCNHGQMLNVLDPALLYGQEYGFRTSESHTAKKGSQFFSNYLDQLFPGRSFERIIEFGCSDGVLLNLLRNKGDKLWGIDPVLKGRESELSDSKVTALGKRVEEIDLAEIMGKSNALVVSQHTMEHLDRPKDVLERFVSSAPEGTVFVLEFPCLDPLLEQYRFDQIFHQHIQYFSLESTLRMIDQIGCTLIDYTFNYTYWGALVVAFSKGKVDSNKTSEINAAKSNLPDKSPESIQSRFDKFKQQMMFAEEAIKTHSQIELYGYGAALMLPILGYHLNTDFSGLSGVFDDDPNKDGLGYINLPVKISLPGNVDFSKINVLLTAMDNRRPIIKKLADKNPRQIINPLSFI